MRATSNLMGRALVTGLAERNCLFFENCTYSLTIFLWVEARFSCFRSKNIMTFLFLYLNSPYKITPNRQSKFQQIH